jgi:uncharacterized protein
MMWMASVMVCDAAGTARAQPNPGLTTKPAMRAVGEKLPDKKGATPADLPPLNVPAEEMKLYGEAAKKGEAWAQTRLAMLLLGSLNNRENTPEAVRLLRAAAVQNDAEALFQLAVLSSQGRGMPLSDEAAFDYMSKSAELGWAEAQYELATMYANGRGISPDQEAALGWARQAAAQGNLKAQHAAAITLLRRAASPEETNEGLSLLKDAAAKKHREAQMVWAGILTRGEFGMAKDESAAETILQSRAREGDNDFQFGLATLYLYGETFALKREEGMEWLRKSAEGGHQESIHLLADLGNKESVDVKQTPDP